MVTPSRRYFYVTFIIFNEYRLKKRMNRKNYTLHITQYLKIK